MTDNQDMPEMEIMEGQKCPMCGTNNLTLTEMEREVPFFGQIAIFSMDCNECHYHKADVEALEEHEPVRYIIDVNCEEDLKIRVVKSSYCLVKIAHVGSIEPGEISNGYVTNIEGILNRIKKQVEMLKETSDEESDIKKAKNILKKLNKVLWGQESIKITLEDPTGNSAIISDKAEKTVLKKSK
jgi:zinc finger protein